MTAARERNCDIHAAIRLPGEIYRDMVTKLVAWHTNDVLKTVETNDCGYSLLCELIQERHLDLLEEAGITDPDDQEAWIEQLAEDAYMAIWRETRFTNTTDRHWPLTQVF